VFDQSVGLAWKETKVAFGTVVFVSEHVREASVVDVVVAF